MPGGSAQDQDGSYMKLFSFKGSTGKLRTPKKTEAVQENFDIDDYLIDIAIDLGTRMISGSVDVRFLITQPPLDTFFVHLHDQMTIDSIMIEGAPAAFVRESGRVKIALDSVHSSADTLVASIHYHGSPVNQGMRFFLKYAYNLSEPDMARNWLPCYDEPWDKATSEMIVTVADSLFCASNGILVDTINNMDGTKTFHWRTSYPHTTYTISVAIAVYDSFSHYYVYGPADSMEMPYYVYPEKMANALVSFANAPAIMSFFSNTFGRYPFIDEVYATAAAPINGAMENFTCTTYGAGFINGSHKYDWIIAHEMAHSWFGNSVTLKDWRDIWLNEGFATYSDALWSENSGGRSAYIDRMEFFKTEYFNEDDQNRFSTYDPDFLWGATVYEKGAWILHMLRYSMGDSTFFASMRRYHQIFKFGSAGTEDFKSICEAEANQDLGPFFDQWVYAAGYPEYRLSWWYYYANGRYETMLHLNQVQVNAPVFTIPVEIKIATTAGDTMVAFPVSSASEDFLLLLDAEPVSVSFDPDDWILKKFEYSLSSTDDIPSNGKLLGRVYPNPSYGTSRLDFYLPESAWVTVDIFDISGRKVANLINGFRPKRWNTVYWNSGGPKNRKASGIYFYKITSRGKTFAGKMAVVR